MPICTAGSKHYGYGDNNQSEKSYTVTVIDFYIAKAVKNCYYFSKIARQRIANGTRIYSSSSPPGRIPALSNCSSNLVTRLFSFRTVALTFFMSSINSAKSIPSGIPLFEG